MRYRFLILKFIYILLTVLFCIGFPYFFTSILNQSSSVSDHNNPDALCQKYIILNDASEKLDVEEFLPYAMAGYLSPSDNEEFLKAFSVLLRTFLLQKIGDNDCINASETTLSYQTAQELKEQWGKDYTKNYKKLKSAVSSTALTVITKDGSLIHPFFHKLSAGTTRQGSESYLAPVSCPDDITQHDYLHTSVYSIDNFISTVKEIYPELAISPSAPLETLQIAERDNAGYVTNFQIAGTGIDIPAFTAKFELASSCFEIDEYNGGIRIITKGIGDGLGLSLNTAKIMAENGKSYNEIVSFFFSGTTLSACRQ